MDWHRLLRTSIVLAILSSRWWPRMTLHVHGIDVLYVCIGTSLVHDLFAASMGRGWRWWSRCYLRPERIAEGDLVVQSHVRSARALGVMRSTQPDCGARQEGFRQPRSFR
jgi:hypothetical protein